ERTCRNDVLEFGRSQFAHELAETGTVYLKNAEVVPRAQHFVDARIFQRDVVQHAWLSGRIFYQRPSSLEDRQGTEAEKIHLEQTNFFDRRHGVLGGD